MVKRRSYDDPMGLCHHILLKIQHLRFLVATFCCFQYNFCAISLRYNGHTSLYKIKVYRMV